jgi:alcohol dehydrogenase (cytochrome c)/quinohemoprotein ethanol dehydrogenase
MSYDPSRRLVFLPTAEMPYGYVSAKPGSFAYDPRGWNTGQDPAASMPEDPKVRAQIRAMMKGALVAWDPVAGRRVWSVPMPLPWNGGVLSTAGGLVFQGNGTGEFAAYAADSGRKLWSVNWAAASSPRRSPTASRACQYVSVAVGWGGILPLNMGEALKDAVGPRVNRIVTFRLDGKAPYALPPVDPKVLPPPASAGDPRQVDEGRTLFHVRCWMCHGDTAVNHGGVPNLRYSQAITDPQMFAAFVLQGVAEPQGMPNFAKDLTAAQAEAIRTYVVKRAGPEGRSRRAVSKRRRALPLVQAMRFPSASTTASPSSLENAAC